MKYSFAGEMSSRNVDGTQVARFNEMNATSTGVSAEDLLLLAQQQNKCDQDDDEEMDSMQIDDDEMKTDELCSQNGDF